MILSNVWVALLFTLFTCTIPICLKLFTKAKPPYPPGPKGLPIIGNLLSLDPELHTYFRDLAQTYGPIFSLRLGSKLTTVITSPALAKEVLKDNDVTFANRDVPTAARFATYGGVDIAWTPYGPQWRLLRKVCVRDLLSPSNLDVVADIRRREIQRTVKFLSGRVGQPVIIGEQMFFMTMNVVTGMLWGGTFKEGEEREILGREFRQIVEELTGLLGVPNLSDFFPSLSRFDLQGVAKKMKNCAKKFDGIFNREIDQRLKSGVWKDMKKDFLDILLQIKDYYEKNGYEGDGSQQTEFSMIHLKAIFMDVLTAGTDTTSNTIEFAMAEVLKKPEVLRKVQQELDTVVGNENMVEEHHIYKLLYLQSIIKETLRMHPTVPLLVPRSPSKTCIVGGYTIPKGSRVFINAWAIHHDPSVWSEPFEFEPERFLNSKFDFNGNDFRYLPFGSGRRICAGITMADRMMLFSLATLLHSFNWRLPEGENLDVEEKFGIVLTKKEPLTLIPEHRLRDLTFYA